LRSERRRDLFDADAAAYTATVEVIGVIFRAEDDGYAVLEVQEASSAEGFALVGPVAHLAHRRPGRSQRRVADPKLEEIELIIVEPSIIK